MRTTLQTEASAGTYDMKDKHILDECEPAASLILSEKERTAMSILVKAFAAFFSIYDVYFRNLAGEDEPGFREDLTGKAKFVLADIPYNVKRDQNVDKLEYGLFG